MDELQRKIPRELNKVRIIFHECLLSSEYFSFDGISFSYKSRFVVFDTDNLWY
jgi:hypothetical protein